MYSSGRGVTPIGILFSLVLVGAVAYILLMKSSIFLTPNVLSDNNIVQMYTQTKILIKDAFLNSLEDQRATVDSITITLNPDTFGNYTVCSSGKYTCRLGEKEGENVNYFYCTQAKSLFSLEKPFCFKTTEISETGEIKKILKYCVYSFVLDKNTGEFISLELEPLKEDTGVTC